MFHRIPTPIALAHADPRVDAVIVPIGSGVLVCRKI